MRDKLADESTNRMTDSWSRLSKVPPYALSDHVKEMNLISLNTIKIAIIMICAGVSREVLAMPELIIWFVGLSLCDMLEVGIS